MESDGTDKGDAICGFGLQTHDIALEERLYPIECYLIAIAAVEMTADERCKRRKVAVGKLTLIDMNYGTLGRDLSKLLLKGSARFLRHLVLEIVGQHPTTKIRSTALISKDIAQSACRAHIASLSIVESSNRTCAHNAANLSTQSTAGSKEVTCHFDMSVRRQNMCKSLLNHSYPFTTTACSIEIQGIDVADAHSAEHLVESSTDLLWLGIERIETHRLARSQHGRRALIDLCHHPRSLGASAISNQDCHFFLIFSLNDFFVPLLSLLKTSTAVMM